ncbi:MAG: PadR family transcriptional regulator [Syntrophomonadaceae bacterium]
MLEFIILGSLTLGDMSGYEIKKIMSNSTAFFSNVSDGSIYPTLKRCEDNGLVCSRELVENGRFKKVYEITEEGRRVFLEWMQTPLKPFIFRYEMLIRIFFAQNISDSELIKLIDRHLAQIMELDSRLQEIEMGPARNVDAFQKTTLRFGRDFYAFLIQWYEQWKYELEGSDGGNS